MKVTAYILGDSISYHYGIYLREYLSGVLECMFKGELPGSLSHIDHSRYDGKADGDSSKVLQFMHELVASGNFRADVLLVNCGLHDIETDKRTRKINTAITDYENNLRAIVAASRELHTKMVWIRTTPVDDAIHNSHRAPYHRFSRDVTAYNAVADRVMKEAMIPVIDLHDFTRNLGHDLFADHVHFHDTVCKKQAACIAVWLMRWKREHYDHPRRALAYCQQVCST
jgi:lysophospholipase L1-like esterase